jgi:hypothetical protein
LRRRRLDFSDGVSNGGDSPVVEFASREFTPVALGVQIDAQLSACGWVLQDYKSVDFFAGRGIALREIPLTPGPCDYPLFMDRKALGLIGAAGAGVGWRLT